MNKNEYLSNASKYFAIGSALLFVSNLINFIVGITGTQGKIAKLGTSTTNFAFYAFLVLAFIAFNGESIGHKKDGALKRKRISGRLKWLIAYDLILMLFKTSINSSVTAKPVSSASGIIVRVIAALFVSGSSLSFFLLVVTLWYFIRDRKNGGIISAVQGSALAVSLFYFLLKTSNQIVSAYGVTLPSEILNTVLCSSVLMSLICLLQYAADIVMFLFVKKHYSDLSDEYEKSENLRLKKAVKLRSLYEERGYGIDECDDTWLNNSGSAEEYPADFDETGNEE